MIELHIIPLPKGWGWEIKKNGKLVTCSGESDGWTKDYAMKHGGAYLSSGTDKPFEVIVHDAPIATT